MDQEELYQIYQSKMNCLEEEREDYERKKRSWQEGREREQAECRQERACLEQLLNVWGAGQYSGTLLSEFEESMAMYDQEIKVEEEALQEERRRLQSVQSDCEEWYEAESQNLSEQEEMSAN